MLLRSVSLVLLNPRGGCERLQSWLQAEGGTGRCCPESCVPLGRLGPY